jgi:hypothetical protein
MNEETNMNSMLSDFFCFDVEIRQGEISPPGGSFGYTDV